MLKVKAIYPGTFDPMTYGHLDILKRSIQIVDKVIIAISASSTKCPLFSQEERCNMVKEYIASCSDLRNVEVRVFDGLLVNLAKEEDAKIIIRGLRMVSDFEYEFQMSCTNKRLYNDIETLFLPASESNQFVSSALVREIASLNGDISQFVLPEIAKKLYVKFFHPNK